MRHRVTRCHHSGFTLLELLIVLSIIGVLVTLLVPSLFRIRETSRMLVCQTHLRQLDLAFMLYTENNGGMFPRPAVEPNYEDWIYWQAGRDPNQGRIQRYVSDRFDPTLYTCPSDDPAAHLVTNPLYPYSYTVNFNICAWDGSSAPYPNQTLSRIQIRDPARCILIIEETDDTLDDGCWAWQGQDGSGRNIPSVRHDKWHRELASTPSDPTVGRGNVGFCDGHVEFLPRVNCWLPQYYNPIW